MKHLFHFSKYLQQKYGSSLQRIPIDLALGCPNRSSGGFGEGCIFCSEDGARARHLSRTGLDLVEQVARGKEYIKRRYGECSSYIAYFQSFTSTNAPVEILRDLYEKVLAQADFKVVIISTRPDALPDDVLDYLAELSLRYELFVELGIQSAHDRTLAEINRGHDFTAVQQACQRLAARNIKIAGHFILGLPGETMDDWAATAEKAADLPLSAVKLHQLMVLKNTVLARRYGANKSYVSPLNEYEYAAGLKAFLQKLPENWLLMRLMADAAADELEAPKWWMQKGQFLSFFEQYFYDESSNAGSFVVARTSDGTPTLYHPVYRQHFHSLAGAGSEAEKKFAEPSRLAEKLDEFARQGKTLRLLDIGFGLGGNAFAAMACAADIPGAQLEIVSLENDERTLRAAMQFYQTAQWQQKVLTDLLEKRRSSYKNSSITLLLEDARKSVQLLPENHFDLVWLDAFSSDVNPELWSWQFLRCCRRIMVQQSALLLTYSSSPSVRGAMYKAGFLVGETPSFGRRRGGTVAWLGESSGNTELSEKEKHIIFDSTAGTPYSDPGLNNQADFLSKRRKNLIERLRKKGVPKWYKAR
ncbi:MAG: TIGR01212 family radical SAM protein [Lentisphaeria bacterium]|nr:TIGR01212 family radical SAM protein [Lentisphaeria bacterium]